MTKHERITAGGPLPMLCSEETHLGRWLVERRKGLRMLDAIPTVTLDLSFLPKITVRDERRGVDVPPGLRGHMGGLVYFVDCGEFTKIGFTRQLIADRLAGIATHNPFPLRLWALVRGTLEDERHWHAYCEDFRHANEWFRFDVELRETLRSVVTECGGEVYA